MSTYKIIMSTDNLFIHIDMQENKLHAYMYISKLHSDINKLHVDINKLYV
jgi:hypothetical protein